MTHRRFVCGALVILAGVVVSCSSPIDSCESRETPIAPARAAIALPSLSETVPREYAGIHNAVSYHEGFVSGGVPEGDAGFETLAAMGARTIISVDGAEPEVEKAAARGMRYIHLPIGYNGFDEKRKLELVRATRDAMRIGPVYIHCHHGKHRSAGAAAVIAASLGWSTPAAGVERMRVSGTAPNYTGLFACASAATVLGASVIDTVPADFPSRSRPASFVKGMIEIDAVFEHLRAIERSGWGVPKEQPDLVPAAEAGRLTDLFRVLADGHDAQRKGGRLPTLLKESSDQAQALEDMLVAGRSDPARLSEQFKVVASSCRNCHEQHRD